MTLDREYFECDNQNIGYRAEGFRDFMQHFAAVERIVKTKPKNVLELGGARGYVAKKLIASGIPAVVLERSEHCYHTRVVDMFVARDIEDIPYPFIDKQFDMVFSDSVMEHLSYEHIDAVIKEITRISNKSLHGMPITDGGQTREQFMSDNTHVIYESKEWWINKFKLADPSHVVEISGDIFGDAEHKITLPKVSYDGTDLIKINIGSYINMFYYGWTNTDILDLGLFAKHCGYIFNQHDSTNPFPVGDGVVDLIFTSHTLEHFKKDDAKNLLKECYRIMKPGGRMRIAVPNVEQLMRQCVDKNLDYLKHISPGAERANCDIDKFCEVAMSNHERLYSECSLRADLKDAGFVDIEVSDPFHSKSLVMQNETIVSHPTISLVMEAVK